MLALIYSSTYFAGPNFFMRGYLAPAIGLWGYKYNNSRFNIQDIYAGVNLGFEVFLSSRFSIHGGLGLNFYRYGRDLGYDTTIADGDKAMISRIFCCNARFYEFRCHMGFESLFTQRCALS